MFELGTLLGTAPFDEILDSVVPESKVWHAEAVFGPSPVVLDSTVRMPGSVRGMERDSPDDLALLAEMPGHQHAVSRVAP